ncbi:tRNA uridine-5-carboxymethylaminomethyl(34) synthesis GTPase MnmE [Amaricoccus sp.]|uniref:tRNA uridine-5-carboxymethylaminomethyl(34) synthesis GTPase MnmE n=1 Tax=Amaricoccus sp. TaxID=1872485 RepID=UPI001B3CE52D|nr:tRNA uridine-5-carboxymethylaminomethyl(34) synthesis GTPase MnmE [Amaricoccus sp.]MBP7240601.1 tRNA uridine-5-carboxymethylaminomethyl(34) synthesis GTPase MnmE [Amaricoccus sp.]
MAATIFAQATPPGRSGIAVIRISGPRARAAAAALGAGGTPDRRAVLRRLVDPRDGRALDDAIVLRFDGPRSFTGEDSVELHLHGGPAVCRSVAEALAAERDLRPAEPGEFTRRALQNGRLDLAQVEGLGDLLAAETAAQSRRALDLVGGRLSRTAERWREPLVRALALIEAGLDFSDEELPDDLVAEAAAELIAVADEMRRELAGSGIAERLRLGFEVALVGAPNVGKSTLLNAMAGREAAITSEFAGTTRDPIEVRMEARGLPITLVDTAGLRDARDPVEAIGVERTRRRANAADLRVFLVGPEGAEEASGVSICAEDLIVRAKADLGRDGPGLAVSGLTGAGIDVLVGRIADVLEARSATAGAIGHERQRVAVERAEQAVRRALGVLGAEATLDLAAEDLRAAMLALDALLGRIGVEDVLDVIFSRFCIGK